jgi:hypothetical protein
MFGARSYRPGEIAVLHVVSAPGRALTISLLPVAQLGSAVAITRQVQLSGPPPWDVYIRLRPDPSGVYLAKLQAADATSYAPFVLRPVELGIQRTLVVEPTNTWQAYNDYAGDSWYRNQAVRQIDLARPYSGDGLPPYFNHYDRGFLRWAAATHAEADFVSDDDLARFASGEQLRRAYDLIVFPGHEEYVTSHVDDIIRSFRDLGGSLAFLSANSFFWKVDVSGNTMTGRWHFDALGRPPSALIGAAYDGWEAHTYPNRPYKVVGANRLPWLFAGTRLANGDTFGLYGIEIDQVDRFSPPGTIVAAQIHDDFGSGHSAEMTYYRRGAAQVFGAGVMNFGGSADSWAAAWTILRNVWAHLGGSFAEPR